MAEQSRQKAGQVAFLCVLLVHSLIPLQRAWADAAPTLYTLIDIGPVAREHNDPERFSINSLHQAVGSAWAEVVGSSPVEFAWIWLPSSAYGLAAGRHRLYGPGGTSGDGPTMALAINDDGIVVGQARFDGEDHAALWGLSDSLEPIDLGLLTTGHGEATSIAYGVSNGGTPTVVGQSDYYLSSCSEMRQAPFTLLYDSTPTMVELAAPSGSHAVSFAIDVNDDSNPKTVGIWGPATTSPCDLGSTSDCGAPFQPITWRQSASTIVLPVLSSSDPMKDQALAVNTSVSGEYDVVGYSSKHPCDPPLQACLNHAAAWRVPSSGDPTLVDLHEAADPALDCSDFSVAHASTNRDSQGRMQVVGKSGAEGAVRWSRGPGGTGSWTMEALQGLVCDADVTGWSLNRPYDITDDGWIVGRGKKCDPYHAFLLVPTEDCPCPEGPGCPGDLDCDDQVDGADLALLLADWGGCGNADLDEDGEVDGVDLATLLAHWGTCESFSAPPSPTLQDLIEILEAGGHHDLAELLQSVWP